MVIFQSVWRKLVTAQAAINDGIFIQLACCWNFSISASNDDYDWAYVCEFSRVYAN